MILEILAGAALGLGLADFARRQGPRAELRILAVGLVVAAVIYLGFAIVGAAESRWAVVEAAGMLPYAAFAWLGLRRAPGWLAVGWLLHAAWDVGLHLMAGTPEFVPGWYPITCIGFDVAVAGMLAVRARRGVFASLY